MVGDMRKYWRLLANNPEYTKLWLAQVVSLTGDWFNTVVLSALVARYSDGSGVAISIFLMVRFLPPLLVSPMAGVLVDRFNRKTLLVWSNLLRALIVPFFLLADSPDMLWVIYVVTVVQFTLSAIFEPGQSAIIPSLVRPTDIVEANTLVSITWSVMLALGAVLGGAFAFLFGTSAAIIADALTFALAGFIIMTMRYEPRVIAPIVSEAGTIEEEDTSFREGVRYVLRTPAMAAAIFVKFGQSIGNVDALMTIFATQIFIMGANGELSLGIMYSAFGLGAFLGPLVMNKINDGSVVRMRRLILLGFITIVVGWLLLGAALTLWAACLALFIRAVGGSVNWTYSNVIIQKTAPDAKLGRMFSLDMAGFQLATVMSTLVHGILIDWVGAQQAYLIALGTGVVALLPMFIWWLVIRWLERPSTATGVLVGGD